LISNPIGYYHYCEVNAMCRRSRVSVSFSRNNGSSVALIECFVGKLRMFVGATGAIIKEVQLLLDTVSYTQVYANWLDTMFG